MNGICVLVILPCLLVILISQHLILILVLVVIILALWVHDVAIKQHNLVIHRRCCFIDVVAHFNVIDLNLGVFFAECADRQGGQIHHRESTHR